MGMPEVPNVNPEIALDKKDVVNLLLLSIAFEELGLAHIINGEGEKIQKGLKYACKLDDLIKLDKTVDDVLKTVIKKEMLLQFKLENVMEIMKTHSYECRD